MPANLRIYYDFASPFCYVARAIVAELRERHQFTVSWLPFEVIDYLPPKGAMPQNPAFVRRAEAARTAQLATTHGLRIHLRERLLNSNLALCAVEQVRQATGDDWEAVDAVHGALFDAFYRDQRDIGDLDTIVAVLDDLGSGKGVDQALRDGRHRARVARSRADAHALGVVAVPTWLCGGYGIVGIVDVSEYERLLATAESAQSTPIVLGTAPLQALS